MLFENTFMTLCAKCMIKQQRTTAFHVQGLTLCRVQLMVKVELRTLAFVLRVMVVPLGLTAI